MKRVKTLKPKRRQPHSICTQHPDPYLATHLVMSTKGMKESAEVPYALSPPCACTWRPVEHRSQAEHHAAAGRLVLLQHLLEHRALPARQLPFVPARMHAPGVKS